MSETIATVDHLREILKKKNEELDSLKQRLFQVEAILKDVADDFKALRDSPWTPG